MDSQSLPPILSIPVELLHRILGLCHPCDAAAFSQTCHLAYSLINNFGDEHLWRQLWLAYPFDDPILIRKRRESLNLFTYSSNDDFHWKLELSKRVKAELIATNQKRSSTHEDKVEALDTFVSLLLQSSPATDDEEPSPNLEWICTVLRRSPLLTTFPFTLQQPPSPSSSSSTKSHDRLPLLQAYLRTCVTGSYTNYFRFSLVEPYRRNHSRCFVYDLRNYTTENDYGPFLPDDAVNWIHVEHLVVVISANLKELPALLMLSRPPNMIDSIRPYSAPGTYSSRDWAGVEGTWRRYVCFMDYRDLFAFNYSDLADGPLQPKFFEDPRFREATRLIEVKLRLISESSIRFYKSSEIAASASPKHPILFFNGTSRGVSGNEAVIEGYVRMAADGTVRWKFVSIYDGHPQWSSNGVQLGDVASATGVVGVWTTTTHDEGDPVGPFWCWKVEDDAKDDLTDYT